MISLASVEDGGEEGAEEVKAEEEEEVEAEEEVFFDVWKSGSY